VEIGAERARLAFAETIHGCSRQRRGGSGKCGVNGSWNCDGDIKISTHVYVFI
jgi:hypothetical protein